MDLYALVNFSRGEKWSFLVVNLGLSLLRRVMESAEVSCGVLKRMQLRLSALLAIL